MNHMQLDAQRVGDLMLFINVLWSGVLQTVGYMLLLYAYIGWASVGGFMIMVVLIPLQKYFFKMISNLRGEQMKLTDRRVKLQNEALSGVKILKLNAWEAPLRREVEGIRGEEMKTAGRVANRNAMNASIMNTGPTLVGPRDTKTRRPFTHLTTVMPKEEPPAAAAAAFRRLPPPFFSPSSRRPPSVLKPFIIDACTVDNSPRVCLQ